MAISVVKATDQFFDNSGDPLNGGTITVYDAGTTTPRAIYTDTALSSSATNPIPLNAYGRPTQGMIYTAATAFKILVKNSSGTQIGDTADYIDPGVPVGTGKLAIVNGGTGADDAAEALSNLGAATASELADLSAEVASISGALGSTEKTSIAKGTTAQRPAVPATSDIRYNTTTSKYELYTGSTWQNPYYADEVLAGTVVKSSYTEYTSSADITAVIAYDDSIPQIGEGTEIISVSFTPTSATNYLRFTFRGMAAHSATGTMTVALFGGGAANAIAATSVTSPSGDNACTIALGHQEVSGQATAKTFAVRAGVTANTMRFNGTSAARRLGGVAKASLMIEEIKV